MRVHGRRTKDLSTTLFKEGIAVLRKMSWPESWGSRSCTPRVHEVALNTMLNPSAPRFF